MSTVATYAASVHKNVRSVSAAMADFMADFVCWFLLRRSKRRGFVCVCVGGRLLFVVDSIDILARWAKKKNSSCQYSSTAVELLRGFWSYARVHCCSSVVCADEP